MTGVALLSTVIWLPILAGVAVLFTGSDRNAGFARWLALAGAVAGIDQTSASVKHWPLRSSQ